MTPWAIQSTSFPQGGKQLYEYLGYSYNYCDLYALFLTGNYGSVENQWGLS